MSGFEVMGKTTEINAFYFTFVFIFYEAIGLSILRVADQGLAFHVVALARTSVFDNFVREPIVLGYFVRSHRLSELEAERVKEGLIVFIEANFISIIIEVSFFALMIIVSGHVLMRIVLV